MSSRRSQIRRTRPEAIAHWIIVLFMTIFCISTLYPFINTLAFSFNEGPDALRGGIYFLPRKFSLMNYERVFSDPTIVRAYAITIARTVIGVISAVFFTGVMAYGLSKPNLMFRRFYSMLCVIAMIFNPGLIPVYIFYRDVHLQNNFLVYILPNCINIWNMILMKTFFSQIPAELEESAEIDGASTFKIFLSIVVPVSMPVIATISIFNGVFQWNAWFDAYMFCARRTELHPIQTYLYKVIALSTATGTTAAESQLLERLKVNVVTIRAATVIITVIPIVFIYSIFQKHFIKGVMVGSLKG